jgi:protocadherin Fat 1/2/3
VAIQVAAVPQESPHPPQIKLANQHVEVTESDQAGYLVALIQASDEDGDLLWYDIVGE